MTGERRHACQFEMTHLGGQKSGQVCHVRARFRATVAAGRIARTRDVCARHLPSMLSELRDFIAPNSYETRESVTVEVEVRPTAVLPPR